jgi:hypothetical protein
MKSLNLPLTSDQKSLKHTFINKENLDNSDDEINSSPIKKILKKDNYCEDIHRVNLP